MRVELYQAADRGTTATAATSACVRRRWSCVQERTMGGVGPNASENGQISPSTPIRDARGGGNCSNCAFALQAARQTTNIRDSSGVIRGIPVSDAGAQFLRV